jgi:FtsH-binding integral membrane protein
METPDATRVASTASRIRIWLGVILIGVGFFGHFFAARAISSGNPRAYPDHMLGFFGILVITGAIIAGLGWRFWKGRRDITVLAIGVVQALFGIWVYIMRFHIM